MRTGMTISVTDRVHVLIHDEAANQRRTRYERSFTPREPAFEGEEVPEGEGEWGKWEQHRYDLRPEFDTGVPESRTLTRGKLLDALNALVAATEAIEAAAPR